MGTNNRSGSYSRESKSAFVAIWIRNMYSLFPWLVGWEIWGYTTITITSTRDKTVIKRHYNSANLFLNGNASQKSIPFCNCVMIIFKVEPKKNLDIPHDCSSWTCPRNKMGEIELLEPRLTRITLLSRALKITHNLSRPLIEPCDRPLDRVGAVPQHDPVASVVLHVP